MLSQVIIPKKENVQKPLKSKLKTSIKSKVQTALKSKVPSPLKEIQIPCSQTGCTELFENSSQVRNHEFSYHLQEALNLLDQQEALNYFDQPLSKQCEQKKEKTFTCGDCQKRYSSKAGLSMHMVKMHYENSNMKTFSKERVKKNEKTFPCLNCQKKYSDNPLIIKSYSSKAVLKMHRVKMHSTNTNTFLDQPLSEMCEKNKNKTFTCGDCKKTINSERGLRLHRTKFHPTF